MQIFLYFYNAILMPHACFFFYSKKIRALLGLALACSLGYQGGVKIFISFFQQNIMGKPIIRHNWNNWLEFLMCSANYYIVHLFHAVFFKVPSGWTNLPPFISFPILVNYENKGFDHAKIVKIEQNSPLFVKE